MFQLSILGLRRNISLVLTLTWEEKWERKSKIATFFWYSHIQILYPWIQKFHQIGPWILDTSKNGMSKRHRSLTWQKKTNLKAPWLSFALHWHSQGLSKSKYVWLLYKLVLISSTEISLCSPQSRPCLSATTHSCVTSQSVGPSWTDSPGSRPARMRSASSTGPASSAAPQPSARPAPLRCLGSWTLWGRSCRPLRSTKPWCWRVCDQT